MSKTLQINRILVLRNDGSERWEDSSYILEKGELGISWHLFGEEYRPVVKTGNGTNLWKDLAQNDYLLLDDLRITQDFGRHKIENGSVVAGGKGKTISEWIIDALTDPQDPEVERPTVQLQITGIETDTKTLEFGSIITHINWEYVYTPGKYPYGSSENKQLFLPQTEMLHSISFAGEPVWHTQLFGSSEYVNTIAGQTETNIVLNDDIDLHLFANMVWQTATNTPVNNLKEEKRELVLSQGSKTAEANFLVQGYREGCYFGGVKGELNNELLRSLNCLGSDYGSQEIEFIVDKGDEYIAVACPASCVGPIGLYNITAGAEILVGDNCEIEQIDVSGANNFTSAVYNVLIYKPAKPFKNPVRVRVTLG